MGRAFLAVADPVRNALVDRLSTGPATVNELAEPFAISKQAVARCIQALEKAELITLSRFGQRRPCHLAPAALEQLTAWIDGYRLAAESSFRKLDAPVAEVFRAYNDPDRVRQWLGPRDPVIEMGSGDARPGCPAAKRGSRRGSGTATSQAVTRAWRSCPGARA